MSEINATITRSLRKQFEATALINRMAGNIYAPSPDTLAHQVRSIIRSETLELQKGVIEANEYETRDGVADVLFTVAGLYARMGYNLGQHHAYPEFVEFNYLERGVLVDGLPHYCAALVALGFANFHRNQHLIAGLASQMVEDAIRIGLMHDFPVVEDFDAVIESNMSKFDTNAEDAERTKQKYIDLGVKTEYHAYHINDEPRYYITRVSEAALAADTADGKDYPEGKWVKSINFKEPVFVEFVSR